MALANDLTLEMTTKRGIIDVSMCLIRESEGRLISLLLELELTQSIIGIYFLAFADDPVGSSAASSLVGNRKGKLSLN